MEFPQFKRILMADALRDGGSYFMLLADGSGATTALHLPVRLDSQGARTGYSEPTLLSHGTDRKARLNWDEAEALARLLEPLCNDSIGEGGPHRAKECLGLLARAGTL